MTPVVRRLLPVPLAVVALAGCSGGEPASAGPAVLAAEQVFAEAPVVVPDPSGTSATLQVTTGIDMACAVVFGREESLGEGIATDADMGGPAPSPRATPSTVTRAPSGRATGTATTHRSPWTWGGSSTSWG